MRSAMLSSFKSVDQVLFRTYLTSIVHGAKVVLCNGLLLIH